MGYNLTSREATDLPLRLFRVYVAAKPMFHYETFSGLFCPIFTKVIHRKRTLILQHRKIARNLIVHLP